MSSDADVLVFGALDRVYIRRKGRGGGGDLNRLIDILRKSTTKQTCFYVSFLFPDLGFIFFKLLSFLFFYFNILKKENFYFQTT